MSDPMHEKHFVVDQPEQKAEPSRVNLREVISVAFLLVGVTMMSVGVGGYLDSLWAGVAVAGTVLTVLGLLLGNN